MGTVYFGTFESEAFWRCNDMAKLPAILEKDTSNIIMGMDELLFAFCKREDTLITRFKMDKAHREYLSDLGYGFACNEKNLISDFPELKESRTKSVSQLLYETPDFDYYKGIIAEGSEISAFSVLPYSEEFSKKYRVVFNAPSQEIVREVNSKVYSTKMHDRIGLNKCAQIIGNSDELEEKGFELLKDTPFLIKDVFGVSGKGNMLVSSEGIFNRILEYIRSQERSGKIVSFILEPFLDKQKDFSCQFYIEQDGKFRVISLQALSNHDFSYHGSETADESLIKYLEENNYFSIMESVAKEMYHDGYFGHVCIDSMILKSGQLIPIVEINARMSMSLIKHQIDEYLADYQFKSNLIHFSVSNDGNYSFEFEDIINSFQNQKILFNPSCEMGIIPLSSSALFINKYINQHKNVIKPYKGRLYVALAYRNSDDRRNMEAKAREALSAASFKIHN